MKLANVILFIVALVLVLVGTVSAGYSVNGTLGTAGSTITLKTMNVGGSGGSYGLVNHTIFNFDFKQPIVIWYDNTYSATFQGTYFGMLAPSNSPKHSDGSRYTAFEKSVTLYLNNVSLGTGRFSYVLNEVTGSHDGQIDSAGENLRVFLNFNEDFYTNSSDYSGVQLLEIRDDSDPNWFKYGLHNITGRGSTSLSSLLTSMDTNTQMGCFGYKAGSSYFGVFNYYSTDIIYNYFRYSFVNSYWINNPDDSAIVTFDIVKTYDGIPYSSNVYLVNTTNEKILYNEYNVNNEDVRISQLIDSTHPLNVRLALLDYSGIWWNKSFTITPIANYQEPTYSLNILPETAGIGQTLTFVLGSSQGWDQVTTWSLFPDYQDENLFYYCNGYPCCFWKMAGNWMQYDGDEYTISWGSAFPETVTGTVDQPGTYTFRVHFFEEEGSGDAYDTVTIAGQGAYAPITFRIEDGSTGALIKSSMIHINAIGNTTWTNTTAASGIYNFNAVVSRMYRYLASATGYEDAPVMVDSWKTGETVPIRLYEADSAGAGNITMQVSVIDYNGDSISGAAVKLSDGRTKTTGAGGLVSFVILDGGTYKTTASKTGYQSNTYTAVMTSANRFVTLQLWAEGDDDGDGDVDDDDDDDITGGSGNYTSGELNERASGGLMEIMGGIINYWWIGFVIFIYAAVKRA